MPELYQSVVITGGAGMLAHALTEALHHRGISAVALSRAACDVTRGEDIARLFEQHRPTLLLNCAAHTKVDLCEDEPGKADAINGHAVGRLAEQAKGHGTTIVHYSTDFVFDGSATRPYRADDPVSPLSAYGRSKLLGERKLQEAAPQRWLILRTAWLYGRHGPNFVRTMVERAKAGQPLRVVSDQIGSPTFTADLAQATLDLLDRKATGVWHLTNSGSTSWFELAKAAVEEFGLKADLSPVTTADWIKLRPRQAKRPAYSVLDVEPFERTVGHPMRPWQDALRDYRQQVLDAGSF